jgi:hypothetical protein
MALSPTGSGVLAATDFTFNRGRLPEAVKMLEAMCGVNVDAKALVIQSERWSHKVVTFVYPAGSTHLWIWDPESKSRELKAKADDPQAIARAWVREMVPGERVTTAFFDASELPSQCKKPA